MTHACPLQESRAASELEQLRDSKRTADAKIEQLSTELNSAQALAQAQRSVATELRKLLDSEKQSSQQTQQKCCDDVDNLQSTVEELEDRGGTRTHGEQIKVTHARNLLAHAGEVSAGLPKVESMTLETSC